MKKRKMTQKKQECNGNYTLFSSKIFKGNEYLEEFILPVKTDKYSFKYTKCKDDNGKLGKILLVNSLKVHILSEGHNFNTPLKRRKSIKTRVF